MISSADQMILETCARELGQVEVAIIEWRYDLRVWKEKLDAEVPA